jgi:hypothetical protein
MRVYENDGALCETRTGQYHGSDHRKSASPVRGGGDVAGSQLRVAITALATVGLAPTIASYAHPRGPNGA